MVTIFPAEKLAGKRRELICRIPVLEEVAGRGGADPLTRMVSLAWETG
jgi:hypothetical protein